MTQPALTTLAAAMYLDREALLGAVSSAAKELTVLREALDAKSKALDEACRRLDAAGLRTLPKSVSHE